jgi:hypothetical protein
MLGNPEKGSLFYAVPPSIFFLQTSFCYMFVVKRCISTLSAEHLINAQHSETVACLKGVDA